jgi:hypothetical protein
VAQLKVRAQELSPAQVLFRFGVRTTILVVFAAFGSSGLANSLSALLGMSIVLTAVLAAVRREPPFNTALNHWDEMVGYAALFSLVASFNQAV